LKDNVLAMVIVVMTVVITVASFKKPTKKQFTIDDSGITMVTENILMEFSNIKSYNIDFNSMKILINTKNNLQTLVHIPFGKNQNMDPVDKFLKTKIKKDTTLKIPSIEAFIGRLIGF
jgi:hypothetical protein